MKRLSKRLRRLRTRLYLEKQGIALLALLYCAICRFLGLLVSLVLVAKDQTAAFPPFPFPRLFIRAVHDCHGAVFQRRAVWNSAK